MLKQSNILNKNHRRTLTIGMNASYFLEFLLVCILFIENLSIGIKDPMMKEKDRFDIIP